MTFRDNAKLRVEADNGLQKCLKGLVPNDNYMCSFGYDYNEDNCLYNLSIWCKEDKHRKIIEDYLFSLLGFKDAYKRDVWLAYNNISEKKLHEIIVLGKVM